MATGAGCSLSVARDRERGVAATRVTLKVKDDAIKREMREVAGVILKSKLSSSVQERALRVFHRLALAHGRLQDVAPERVIMHEAGIKLTALVAPEKQELITDIIFAETPSVGVRTYQAERRMLDREIMSIKTDFGPIRVKVARQMGAITNLMPEYKDCVSAAKKQGVPLKAVWQATLSQALQQTGRAG